VTKVSMNLRPSNLGANFSLFDEPCEWGAHFFTEEEELEENP
jgi:hypothetical protein